MPRNKTKRSLSFKPRFKTFVPKEGAQEALTLLHEEIEAIFLMDYQGLYQEDAAKSMGVSRPTFSRIIKNARLKVASALVNGKALQIRDEKEELRIAFICEDKESFGMLSLEAPYIICLTLKEEGFRDLKVLENPVHHNKGRPGSVLPTILHEEKVNYFLSEKVGEGMKNSLLTRGIFVIKKEKITQEDLQILSKELR